MSVETRKKISESNVKTMSAKKYGSKSFYNTKPEIRMKNILNDLNIKFIHQYPLKTKHNHFLVDFFIPLYNIVIEVDGKYWHAHPSKFKADDIVHHNITAKDIWKIDSVKNEKIRQSDYKLLRFWENEFDLNKVKSAIDDIQSSLIYT
jgi:very-short-patch-repair endonuclease